MRKAPGFPAAIAAVIWMTSGAGTSGQEGERIVETWPDGSTRVERYMVESAEGLKVGPSAIPPSSFASLIKRK